jgi:hypothetical protein
MNHTGRELPLMLESKKPLAMFYAEVSELPNDGLIPEQDFAPHVASGLFIRGETTVEAKYHLKLQRNVRIKYVFFALKAEDWRIEAMKLLLKESGKTGWNETCERIEGSLLGYTDEENDAHCKSRFPTDPA